MGGIGLHVHCNRPLPCDMDFLLLTMKDAMTHRAFKTLLIDPFTQTITEVEYRGEYTQIYELIDAECFDVARINRNGDALFVDDEGLHREGQAFFMHKDYPQPLAGKALLLGCNLEDGETVAPTETLEELTANVSFVMPIRVNGSVVWLDAEGAIAHE